MENIFFNTQYFEATGRGKPINAQITKAIALTPSRSSLYGAPRASFFRGKGKIGVWAVVWLCMAIF